MVHFFLEICDKNGDNSIIIDCRFSERKKNRNLNSVFRCGSLDSGEQTKLYVWLQICFSKNAQNLQTT